MNPLLPVIEDLLTTAEKLLSESRIFFENLMLAHAQRRAPDQTHTGDSCCLDFPIAYAVVDELNNSIASDIETVVERLKELRNASKNSEDQLIGRLLALKLKLDLIDPTVDTRRQYFEELALEITAGNLILNGFSQA